MQSQHKDLETYYTDQIKVQPGNKGLKDKAKADLGRSREQYIGFVKRVSESDKNWYLNVNNGESLANKRARVQKMREKAQRMKQMQNESMSMGPLDTSMGFDSKKKKQITYEFDARYAPVKKQNSNTPKYATNDSYESYRDTGGDVSYRGGDAGGGGGGMGMGFDFSSKPKKAKAKKGKKGGKGK